MKKTINFLPDSIIPSYHKRNSIIKLSQIFIKLNKQFLSTFKDECVLKRSETKRKKASILTKGLGWIARRN